MLRKTIVNYPATLLLLVFLASYVSAQGTPSGIRRPIPRKDAFLGMHFDLHPQKTDTLLGADITDENLAALLDRVKPDYVQYDCKGHAGYTGYPTKVGWASPGIVKDSLAICAKRLASVRSACSFITRAFGIRSPSSTTRNGQRSVRTASGTPMPPVPLALTSTSFSSRNSRRSRPPMIWMGPGWTASVGLRSWIGLQPQSRHGRRRPAIPRRPKVLTIPTGSSGRCSTAASSRSICVTGWTSCTPSTQSSN